MTQATQSQQMFHLHVIAASPAALLATLSVAGILGIEPQQAADRLASLPTALVENVPDRRARELSALLTAFGFRVRLDPTHSAAIPPGLARGEARRDVALQPTTPDEMALMVLAGRLGRLLPMPADAVREELDGPEGLVLRDVPQPRIDVLRAALRRDRAVRVVVSDEAVATFDAFRVPGRSVPGGDLVRLGLSRCKFSGAVAAGMNHATAQHLAQRAGGRLLIANRDFQRFDLVLMAAPGLAPKELAGFLDARPQARASEGSAGPRLVERGLGHDMARQFVADYAVIGLEVQALLRRGPCCAGPEHHSNMIG